MATADDIDVQSAVRKFLERPVVTNREDPTADTADEVTAILEATAVSFLLQPQAALAFILLAKNNFQQLVRADIDLLDYLVKAVDDVSNPNELIDDTSDLIEAQTALVEVDRIGRVADDIKAYDRYTLAVTRFLDRRLARSLKRRRRNEFERSGTEAKRDMFQALAAHSGVHQIVSDHLGILSNSVADFESVDLTKVVASRTLTRVRNSLKKVLDGIAKRTLSKTSMAVELLAGAAALKSISKTKGVYDAIVESDELPIDRIVEVSSEPVPAESSSATVLDLSGIAPPWSFDVAVDGEAPATIDLGEGGPFLLSGEIPDSLIDVVGTWALYVQIEGVTTTPVPDGQTVLVKEITLPPGTDQTVAAMAAFLDTELGPDAECLDYGDRLLIVGAAGTTRLVVRSFQPGTFDSNGDYVSADESGHELLGFAADQESETDVFRPDTLAAMLNVQLPDNAIALVEDGVVVVQTVSTEPDVSLVFTGEVATELGFVDAVAEPSYLELVEDGSAVDPADLGILVGAVVTVIDAVDTGLSFFQEPITRIEDTKLFFASGLVPRCAFREVTISSPLVFATQSLIDGLRPFVSPTAFAKDSQDLQRLLTPLLSRPTLAQINDAKRALNQIRDRLQGLLDTISPIVVSRDKNEFLGLVNNIVLSLEERGLDRALDLLRQGAFSQFFSLDNAVASKSSRLLKAIEEVGRKDFPVTSVEEDQEDSIPVPSTPDDDLLPGEELSEREEDFL